MAELYPQRTSAWGGVIFPKLSSLWRKGIGCDVTIVCHDGSIKAPSALLCALSKSMHRLILLSDDQILTFLNVSVIFWEKILDVMYSGHHYNISPIETKDFLATLLTANALEMNDTLFLFNHLLTIDKDQDQIHGITKELASQQDAQIECCYKSAMSSFTEILVNEDLGKMSEIFQQQFLETAAKPKVNILIQLCMSCEENCTAEKVQCLYCNYVLSKTEGVTHMDKNHKFCPSNVWPFSCLVEENKVKGLFIKGHRIELKLESGSQSGFRYKCEMCDYSTENSGSFIDHFLTHGFFPKFCSFCGDVFCDQKIQKYHKEYCGSDITEHYLTNIQQVEGKSICENEFEGKYSGEFVRMDIKDHCTDGVFGSDEFQWEELETLNETANLTNPTVPESACIICLNKCVATEVMCLFCNEIVTNNISHMQQEHSQSVNAKGWAYTCKIPNENEQSHIKMVVVKSLVDDVAFYHCRECLLKDKDKEKMFHHLKSAHQILSTFYCSHCDSGFIDVMCRNKHQHLCGGGHYIQCKKCKVFFGSVELLQQHSLVCIKHERKEKRNAVDKKLRTIKCVKMHIMHTEDSLLCASSVAIGKKRNVSLESQRPSKRHKQETLGSGEGTDDEDDSLLKSLGGNENFLESNSTDLQPNVTWGSVCYTCGKNCSAEYVKCIYCLKVVENNIDHMVNYHPLTPKSSKFVYTCNFLKKSATSLTDWLVCVKERVSVEKNYKEKDSSQGETPPVFRHRCLKCLLTFPNLSAIKTHCKKEHNVFPTTCRICDTGLAKPCYLKDHQHFCSGGELITCHICLKLVGTYKAYYNHMFCCHSERSSEDKVQNTADENPSSEGTDSSYDQQAIDNPSVIPKTTVKNSENLVEEDESFSASVSEYDISDDYLELPSLDVEPDVTWKSVCYTCGESCGAEYVKCIYCLKIVQNNCEHMEKCHPFTPKSSMFVYTCNFLRKTVTSLTDWLVCVKEVTFEKNNDDKDKIHHECPQKESTGVFQYRCLKCQMILPNLSDVKIHCKELHNVFPSICKICGTGLAKPCYLKDHQHFCSGGELIRCHICFKLVGTYKAYYDHMFNCHFDESKNMSDKKHRGELNDSSDNDSLMQNVEKDESFLDFVSANEDLKSKAAWRPVCYTCGENCCAEYVKCIYCYKVVEKSNDHMAKYHPFTPKSSMFAYTCKYLQNTATTGTDWLVSLKEQLEIKLNEDDEKDKIQEEHSQIFRYRCLKCQNIFQHLSDLRLHLKQEHNISAQICKICHMGLSKPGYLKDHQHFCSGGEPVICKICFKIVGTYKAYYDHMFNCHKEGPKPTKIRQTRRKIKPTIDEYNPKEELKKEIIKMKGELNKIKLTGEDFGVPDTEKRDEVCFYEGENEHDFYDDDQKLENTAARDNDNDIVDNTDDNVQSIFQMAKRTNIDTVIKICVHCNENCCARSVCCLHCMKSVFSEDKDDHIKDHHPSLPNVNIWPVKCKYFQKNLASSNVVAFKMEKESMNNEGDIEDSKVYKCQLCSTIVFTTEKSANEHILEVHGIQTYFCDVCSIGLETRTLKNEHQHFCEGNDILNCLKCHNFVATWQDAIEHKTYCTGMTETKSLDGSMKHKTRRVKVMRNKLMRVTDSKSEKYGYKIICADCRGPCNAEIIKCGLCNEIGARDDNHMKRRHPYSACSSWIVYCKHYNLKVKRNLEKAGDIIAERISVASLEELVEENSIPSNFPCNYKCNQCAFVTAEKSLLETHVAVDHNEMALFSCDTCNAMMRNKFHHIDHSHFCSKGELHVCDLCNKELGSYARLVRHRFTVHPKNLEPNSAKINKIVIPKGTVLECPKCEFKTSDYHGLRSHNMTVHRFPKRYASIICPVCFKVFHNITELQRHKHKVHLNGQRCLCEICGKDFEIPLKLKSHVRYYHRGEREHTSYMHKYHRPRKICQHCGKMYKNHSSLSNHIRVAHEQRLYHCEICAKVYYSDSSLKRHLLRHGEKKYSCPQCNHKAYDGRDINRHVARVHPGIFVPYPKATVIPENENKDQLEILPQLKVEASTPNYEEVIASTVSSDPELLNQNIQILFVTESQECNFMYNT